MGSFDHVIAEHLELKRRNSGLEQSLPISLYRDTLEIERPGPKGILEADPPTEPVAAHRAPPWDDPDSWWNVADSAAGW